MRIEQIHIGGVFASREESMVRTVLGSCVAACLYDAEAGIGGMNHFMLPAGSGDLSTPARYGVHAMELLINRIMAMGGDRRRLKAKAFGGGNVLGVDAIGVGRDNVAFVKAFLSTEGIPLTASRLGGDDALEVRFYTREARVLVRPVERSMSSQLARRESQFKRLLEQRAAEEACEEVSLF